MPTADKDRTTLPSISERDAAEQPNDPITLNNFMLKVAERMAAAEHHNKTRPLGRCIECILAEAIEQLQNQQFFLEANAERAEAAEAALKEAQGLLREATRVIRELQKPYRDVRLSLWIGTLEDGITRHLDSRTGKEHG